MHNSMVSSNYLYLKMIICLHTVLCFKYSYLIPITYIRSVIMVDCKWSEWKEKHSKNKAKSCQSKRKTSETPWKSLINQLSK